MIGQMNTKTTVYRKSDNYDVANPPSQWVPILRDYYVSIATEAQTEAGQMGGTATVDRVNITGHWVTFLEPGMRLVAGKKTYRIVAIKEVFSQRLFTSMTCEEVTNGKV